jgi:hypothetical protein
VFDFFDDFLGTACNASRWDVIQHQYTSISVSSGIVSLTSSPPSATRSTAIFGFSDTVVAEGEPYTTITTNAVHFGNDVFSTVNPDGGTSIPWGYQDAWKVFDACWINPTTAQGYVNDTLVGTLTTNLPTKSIPIQFIARGMIWGPGTHYAAILRSKDLTLGQAGFAMRSKAREYYDYVTTPDANPPEIHVDWVLVRKCSLNEPAATLVQVEAIDAILEEISSLVETLKVQIAENLHGCQLQKCTKYANAAAALVAQMIEDRESGNTPCRATISKLSRYVDKIKDMVKNSEIRETCTAIDQRIHDLKAIVDRGGSDHHGHCNDDHHCDHQRY